MAVPDCGGVVSLRKVHERAVHGEFPEDLPEGELIMAGRWTGDLSVHNLVAGADVATTIALVPTIAENVVDAQQDMVLETCHIHLCYKRLLVTGLDAMGFVVYLGKVLVGTSTLAQALDPLSLSTFAWADGDIMLQGLLPVPPTVSAGNTGAAEVDNSLVHQYIHVKSKRKFKRANHGIFLSLSTDVSSVIRCTTVRRSYLKAAAD